MYRQQQQVLKQHAVRAKRIGRFHDHSEAISLFLRRVALKFGRPDHFGKGPRIGAYTHIRCHRCQSYLQINGKSLFCSRPPRAWQSFLASSPTCPISGVLFLSPIIISLSPCVDIHKWPHPIQSREEGGLWPPQSRISIPADTQTQLDPECVWNLEAMESSYAGKKLLLSARFRQRARPKNPRNIWRRLATVRFVPSLFLPGN